MGISGGHQLKLPARDIPAIFLKRWHVTKRAKVWSSKPVSHSEREAELPTALIGDVEKVGNARQNQALQAVSILPSWFYPPYYGEYPFCAYGNHQPVSQSSTCVQTIAMMLLRGEFRSRQNMPTARLADRISSEAVRILGVGAARQTHLCGATNLSTLASEKVLMEEMWIVNVCESVLEYSDRSLSRTDFPCLCASMTQQRDDHRDILRKGKCKPVSSFHDILSLDKPI